jgi:hypothetical protein
LREGVAWISPVIRTPELSADHSDEGLWALGVGMTGLCTMGF